MKYIKLPIGFRFVYGDEVYKVIEDKELVCEDCGFYGPKCSTATSIGLACAAETRDDGCDVSFKLVGYVYTPSSPDSL